MLVADDRHSGCNEGERSFLPAGRTIMRPELPRPGVNRGGAVVLSGTLRISTAGHGVVHMHPAGYLCHVPSESLHWECPESSVPAQNRVHALTRGGLRNPVRDSGRNARAVLAHPARFAAVTPAAK